MNQLVKYIIQFVLLILLQVLIIDQVQLGKMSSYITPFIYFIFILTLPHTSSAWLVMLIGFAMGITTDIFNGTLGIHASSLVMLAYIRPFLLKSIAPRDGFDVNKKPSIYSIERNRFIAYVLISSFIFHLWFFTVEILRFSSYHITLLKAVLSAIVATILITILQYITEKK